MKVVHDLICANDHVAVNVVVEVTQPHVAPPKVAPSNVAPYGSCGECQEPYEICWLHGKAPSTDVLGQEVQSDLLGLSYTSTRERDRKMKARGYEPAANIRGGPMSQSNHLPEKLTPRGYEGRAEFGEPS